MEAADSSETLETQSNSILSQHQEAGKTTTSLAKNIFLSTLLSNTPNLSHFVTGQVPHPQTC
jgi:hypothetical protein